MSNLLIVDDELGMRQFLTHLLQREGHNVRVAENGRRAWELLPEVEVIMMTAFASVDTAREAFLLGAYDFVQKPFDNELLKETVARALQKVSLVKEKQALLEENKA